MEIATMKLSKIWLTGALLSSTILWNCCQESSAQEWQGKSADNTPVSTNWDQRVLKRPQESQWHAVQPAQNVSYNQPIDPETSTAHYQRPVKTTSLPTHYRSAQRPVSNRDVFETVSIPKQPTPAAPQAEVIPPGEVQQSQPQQFEPIASEGPFAEEDGCSNCGGCGECDACETTGCNAGCDNGWEVFDGHCGPWLKGLSVFAGVDGFKGSRDRGTNGNFGVNEGVNLARPLGDPWGCGYQIGANFVQSDFSGVETVGASERGRLFPANFRKQYFVTAGLFRRADECGGLQGGIAYDYLYDMYDLKDNSVSENTRGENASLQQLRSETGFVLNSTYDIGYYGAYGVGTDRHLDGKLDPTDMFVLYVRRNFENGGDGRIWGGASGNGDGLIGVDLWVPLGNSFALENRANYMIPKGSGDTAQSRESWGLVMQLVWYPGQNAKCQQRNPYRPLFNVADNSLFMVDRMAQ
jgi:hypothetical protein